MHQRIGVYQMDPEEDKKRKGTFVVLDQLLRTHFYQTILTNSKWKRNPIVHTAVQVLSGLDNLESAIDIIEIEIVFAKIDLSCDLLKI